MWLSRLRKPRAMPPEGLEPAVDGLGGAVRAGAGSAPRKPATNGPQGPALPFMAAQGTAAHPARAPPDRAKGELNRWVFQASHSRIPEIVELSKKKIRRRRPDIPRTIEPGCSNARLEAFSNRIKVTIRMAYGFHRVTDLIALIMLRCSGLDIRLPQPTI